MISTEVLERLRKAEVVIQGSVTLHAGANANVYYDIKKAYGDPFLFHGLVRDMTKMIPQETTCVAGSGHGGIPLATAIALGSKLKLCLIREKPKRHGRKTRIDGHIPGKNDVVVIVDDVLSTGNSIDGNLDALKGLDTQVWGAYVILRRMDVQYSASVAVRWLCTSRNLE